MSKKHISRRKFLGTASCAAIGSTALFSTLINLKALNAAAMANSMTALSGDYKALVCIFLAGGNDSYNMLMPNAGTAYDDYATTRSNLAIAADQMLPLNLVAGSGEYGIHPSMSSVQQLFNDQKLAFLANTGTLIEPTTAAEYNSGAANAPLGLYSHSDQQQQWQTGFTHERSTIGWAGRISDLIGDMNTNQNIAMNVSLSGTNILQSGGSQVQFVVNQEGSQMINQYGQPWNFSEVLTSSINSLMDYQYQDVFKQTYVDITKNSIAAGIEFQEAIDGIPEFNATFSENNNLSQNLRMVAKSIAARDILGFKRQVFFVQLGGWDHHDELLENQAALLNVLSTAMGEFNAVLEEMDMADCVTTFQVSDFARTLTSNGNGTDHAWGGNVMVMGGAVNGGQLFGSYPSLALNGPQSVEYGSVTIPTTSVDEYLAELALWFGVSPTDIPMLFPNIGNFYTPGPDLPLGFLNG